MQWITSRAVAKYKHMFVAIRVLLTMPVTDTMTERSFY